MPLPWMYLILLLIAMFRIVGIFVTKIKRLDGKKIAVLGMKGAGKTRLLCLLQNKAYVEQETLIEHYDKFAYTKENGEKVEIMEGCDIGGGEDFIASDYWKKLANCDNMMFLFDIDEFLSNKNYQEQVCARLDFIYERWQKPEKTAVFATHMDRYFEERNLTASISTLWSASFRKTAKALDKSVWEVIKGKRYESLFKTNFFVVNMLEEQNMKSIIDKIL